MKMTSFPTNEITYETAASDPKGSFLKPSVICNSKGFKPVFTYDTAKEEHHIAINIDIGGFNKAECVSSMPTMPIKGTTIFGYSNFSSNYTEHIPYMENATHARCGGLFEHWTDTSDSNKEKIRYETKVIAIITRMFRSKIERKTQYPFIITCLLEREVNGVSTNKSFRVLEELVNAANVDRADDTFTFAASIKFHEDNTYSNELTQSIVTPKNNEKLFLEVKQAENQTQFKFVVNKCYTTRGSTAITDDNSLDKDIFFKNQCPVDETVGFQRPQYDKFQLEILSFSFPNPVNTIYFHCNLYVCLANNRSTPCTQKQQSECEAIRQRRAVEGVDYDYEKTITAAQPVLFEEAHVFSPWCGEGFLYDREQEMCSRENLLEVRNICLSQDIWQQEYANTSSLAFKNLAKTKEYQFWVLLKATRQNKIIHGVKVLRARPGSVIMDVAIKYSDSLTAEQAFSTFKQVLYTPATVTRVQSILQISHKKDIEYVPVMRSENSYTEKLILIVVVAVLFVIIFIAGGMFFKVRLVRQTSTTHAALGFDNKGIDA